MESIKGRVSIIIPTRNRCSYLRRAVDAAFAQDYKDVEVILSNNASTDDSESVLKDLQKNNPDLIVVNHSELLPLNKHWDLVIRSHATGEFLMVIPDDDILVQRDYISSSIALFEKYSSIGLVFANYNIVNNSYEKISSINAKFEQYIPKEFLFENYNKRLFGISGIGISHLTTVFKKSYYLDVNGFDLECMSPDTYLWLKLLLKYDAGFVSQNVADYLIHESNLSSTSNLDYKFSDTSIVPSVKKYAIDNDLMSETVSNALIRMEKIFHRNFHYAYVNNIFNWDFKYVSYWKKIELNYFVQFIISKAVGKDYPND